MVSGSVYVWFIKHEKGKYKPPPPPSPPPPPPPGLYHYCRCHQMRQDQFVFFTFWQLSLSWIWWRTAVVWRFNSVCDAWGTKMWVSVTMSHLVLGISWFWDMERWGRTAGNWGNNGNSRGSGGYKNKNEYFINKWQNKNEWNNRKKVAKKEFGIYKAKTMAQYQLWKTAPSTTWWNHLKAQSGPKWRRKPKCYVLTHCNVNFNSLMSAVGTPPVINFTGGANVSASFSSSSSSNFDSHICLPPPWRAPRSPMLSSPAQTIVLYLLPHVPSEGYFQFETAWSCGCT